jgi:hypothetical protein
MRSELALAAIGLASIAAVAACSSSSEPGNTGGSGSSAGSTSSGSAGSGSTGSSDTSSGDTASGSTSSGDTSSGTSSTGSAGSGTTSSGSTSGTSSGGTDGGTSAGDSGVAPVAYPAGPYCAAAGQNGAMATGCVIPNLNWNGYVDDSANALATTKPYVAYSLLDLYNSARVSGKKYAMVNIAEFDCPGCASSAMEMGMTTDGGVSAGASVDLAGGILIEVLMTSGFVAPPTKANLDAWIGKYNLDFTTVADLSAALTTNNTLGRRDQAYIIDLTTMKILKYIDGSIAAAGSNNSGALGVAAMHTLLGK